MNNNLPNVQRQLFSDLKKEGRKMGEKLDLEKLQDEQPIDIARIMAGEEF